MPAEDLRWPGQTSRGASRRLLRIRPPAEPDVSEVCPGGSSRARAPDVV